MNTSEQNKQEVMSLVLANQEDVDHDWLTRYSSHVNEFLKDPPKWLEDYPLFLGEDVTRWMIMDKKIGLPHHENSWGAQFNAKFAHSGFIIKTGKTRNATAGKSNAHAFRLWLSLLCEQPDSLVTLNQQLVGLHQRVKTRKIDVLTALKLAAQYGAESIT